MTVNPLRAALAALLLAVTLTGCQPIDEGPNKPKPSVSAAGNRNVKPDKNAEVPPDYIVEITASDPRHPHLERVSRVLLCSIIGTDLNDDVVTLTNPTTGETGEYVINFERQTPKRILLYGARGLAFLHVTCTMFGKPGDSILCEFTTGEGRRLAPLIQSQEYSVISRGKTFTKCSGTINTLA